MLMMSAKFDEEACYSLVCVSLCLQGASMMHTHTHGRTEIQQLYYIPSTMRCARINQSSEEAEGECVPIL